MLVNTNPRGRRKSLNNPKFILYYFKKRNYILSYLIEKQLSTIKKGTLLIIQFFLKHN